MRQLTALIGALILLAALAPCASATVFIPSWVYDNTEADYFPYQTYSLSFPYMITPNEAGVTAFCTALGHGTHTNEWTWKSFSDNATAVGGVSGSGYSSNITIDGSYNYTAFAFACGGAYHWGLVGYKNTTVSPVVANFTANIVQGSGPFYVSFTDTSTAAPYPPSAWNWSITPATGWLTGPYDLDNEDLTVLFTDNGNYTVSHGVNNTQSSDIETKTDYIWVFNSSATVTTGVTAQDMYSGYPVQGAQVDLFDVENSSWTNTTTGANGKGEITTLMHHTINAYASAGGYGDNEALGLDADGSGYTVVLTPSGFANVSAGSVTAYVTVVDDDGSFRIPEARVDVSYGGASYSIQTNAAGVASFVVPNQTNVLVHARKAGYTGASKSFNSGTGSGGDAHVDVEVRLAKTTYTPTITATTLPGGGTPTTAQTVDPFPCDADHPENCQRKQTEMANILVELGPDLVLFFIVLTLIGGAKMVGK